MSLLNSDISDHTIRRMSSVVHTLNTVAQSFSELEKSRAVADVEFRWELLILAENLVDIASYVIERSRTVAWGPDPLPFDPDTGLPEDDL